MENLGELQNGWQNLPALPQDSFSVPFLMQFALNFILFDSLLGLLFNLNLI